MQTFIGNIEGKRDDKGRIFIPATYRRILSEQGSTRVIMRRDTDNQCIIFYPESVWNQKVTSLREALDEWNPEDQMLLMQFMAEAETMEPDSQGRVLLSKRILESLDIEQEVLFVGMMDRFALWAPKQFANKRLEGKDLSARIQAKMAQRKAQSL